MKKILLISALLLFLLNSCHISGSFKGLYSYYNKTKKESPDLLLKSSTDICSLTYSSNVYIINGQNLKNCLKQEDKSMVFIWAPKCTSRVCIPLDVVQEYCTKNHITLSVVAEYYDSELMKKVYNIKKPIFGIDTEFYQTSLTDRYLNAFMNDIAQTNYSNKRYLYFEKGVLKNMIDELDLSNL